MRRSRSVTLRPRSRACRAASRYSSISVLPAARGRVQALEGLEGFLVSGLDAEDGLERQGRLVVVVDLFLPELGHLEQLVDLLLGSSSASARCILTPMTSGQRSSSRYIALELGHRLEVARLDLEQVTPGVGRFERLTQHANRRSCRARGRCS